MVLVLAERLRFGNRLNERGELGMFDENKSCLLCRLIGHKWIGDRKNYVVDGQIKNGAVIYGACKRCGEPTPDGVYYSEEDEASGDRDRLNWMAKHLEVICHSNQYHDYALDYRKEDGDFRNFIDGVMSDEQQKEG